MDLSINVFFAKFLQGGYLIKYSFVLVQLDNSSKLWNHDIVNIIIWALKICTELPKKLFEFGLQSTQSSIAFLHFLQRFHHTVGQYNNQRTSSRLKASHGWLRKVLFLHHPYTVSVFIWLKWSSMDFYINLLNTCCNMTCNKQKVYCESAENDANSGRWLLSLTPTLHAQVKGYTRSPKCERFKYACDSLHGQLND